MDLKLSGEANETDEQRELRDLEAQINAARDRAAAADAKRSLRLKRLEAADALREAEDKEKLLDLEAEHGPIGRNIAGFSTPFGLVVVKRSAPVVWKRFLSSRMKDKDHEDLVRACLLSPAAERFNEIIEEQPALLLLMANKIGELYGLKKEEDSGK